MQLPDYHIHTARCGHAGGEMHEYVEKALELGLREIGFADHIPMYWLEENERDPSLAMSPERLPEYVAEVERLRSYYRGITIKLGIEVDFIPGYEDEARRVLDAYPFDYVLGSVHYIDGWGFDNPAYIEEYKNHDIDELYRKYFKLVQQAARSGLFNVMAHPDLIKKFGYRPKGDLRELYAETAWVFAESGVCIEINTAGLRAPVEEIYPGLILLQECRKRGVPVTTGSDAHVPDQVGYRFDRALSLLTGTGYTKVLFFQA
ncbi:histidinol-phosphatase HisJ family protein [Desulfallas sp. Bu1-1]|uniref:histidinol-phosphatase HisJ family protein n=1 Tax=Desulfallas sp. Bu1-1 TaxID=2787620 RepID=UPI00189D2F03|nr:histidinol-phosphatase HisJ family protein [Desulfallas sp. Bu1-1]MBF7083264.1 histidinol-phosphatase HisJ family protein [Desulfallas sp. Bu1-1]